MVVAPVLHSMLRLVFIWTQWELSLSARILEAGFEKFLLVVVSQKKVLNFCWINLNPATSTLAGNSIGYADGIGPTAMFSYPTGIVASTSTFYVSDTSNNRIRMISSAGENSIL
jgi:hypothetical protein